MSSDQVLKFLLVDNRTFTHSELLQNIKELAGYLRYEVEDLDVDYIVREFERQKGIKTFSPDILFLEEGHTRWFEEATKEFEKNHVKPEYFERYRNFLQKQKFSPQTIEQIERNTRDILSMCANPNASLNAIDSKKKGLVIGDVQSGKTANFLALINLAIDYGYKMIIVLSGITEYLRRQTQKRVDSGVIGAISGTINSYDIKYIGVGERDDYPNYYAIPLTTDNVDFIKFVKSHSNFAPADTTKPIIIVGKKNSSVLTQIGDWVGRQDINAKTKNILIIDDEADNASVNTKKTTEDPSRINGLIRNIISKVNIASYVGFTATPFANIFINPFDVSDESTDLFPSDFIVQLHSDSNYFGHKKVFKENRIIKIEESERDFMLPVSHKRDASFSINPSLKEAIKLFLITNVIRTLRGDGTAHRTMMINISVFNDVQDKILYKVKSYVENLRRIISQTSHYEDDKFFRSDEMKELFRIYSSNSKLSAEYDWEKIKHGFYDEITKFEVRVFNNKHEKFIYEDYDDVGARLIAIGGYVLSRGLTLNGLNISYFNRRTAAYDTMLQMSRWFGYRPNYEDLCFVYMTQLNIDNFGAVAEAVEDLKVQFKEMKLKKKKPRDFGLMVKESPETLETDLIITARNKMRQSRDIEIGLNYGGVVADTSKIFKNKKYNNNNLANIQRFVEEIKRDVVLLEGVRIATERSRTTRQMYRNVNKKHIAKLVRGLSIPLENRKFDIDNISEYIENSDVFDFWDVVIAEGNERKDSLKFTLSGRELTTVERKTNVISEPDEDFFRMGGSNNRVVDPGIFNSGLTAEQIEEAKAIAIEESKITDRSTELIAKDYLRVRNRKPLLIILPIELSDDEQFADYKSEPLLGFGIGFPAKEDPIIVRYKANPIKIKELADRRKYTDLDEEEYDED